MTAAELLDDCAGQLERHLERVAASRARVDETAWNRRTAKDEWSPGEVVEHMIASHAPYVTRVAEAIARAGRDNGEPIANTWFGRTLIKNAGPNGNVPPPGPTRPARRAYTDADLDRWRDQCGEWRRVIESARGKDLRVKIKNPIVGIFSMNLVDCFALIRDHTERHVRQIEERTASSAPR